MRKTVYVILALCCFIIKTYSINRPYYHFKQLSIKEGLPTSITSLYDDKNGSLWVGTTQGIYRFNGEKIKKYNLPDLLRKNSHYINDIFGDNEERIWAVTSQGISYYEYEKDSLQIFLRHNKPVKTSIIATEGSKLLIPVTDEGRQADGRSGVRRISPKIKFKKAAPQKVRSPLRRCFFPLYTNQKAGLPQHTARETGTTGSTRAGCIPSR